MYDLVGHKPENPSTIPEMARYLLASGATIIDIAEALDRCVRECQYPIRLPDIMQRIPGNNVPQPEAEMRAAWDTLMQFANKYLGTSPHGYWHPDFGFWGPKPSPDDVKYPATYPILPDRILDTVRRTGGWEVYGRCDEKNFPFVQKRFFDEYQAWVAVEKCRSSRSWNHRCAVRCNSSRRVSR